MSRTHTAHSLVTSVLATARRMKTRPQGTTNTSMVSLTTAMATSPTGGNRLRYHLSLNILHCEITNRKPSLAEADEDEEAARSDSHMLPPLTHIQSRGLNQAGLDHESLTLGTNTGATPLNGLMHHLRQQSNQSEITQAEEKQSLDEVPEIPEWNPKNLDLIHRPTRTTTEPESRIGSTYTSSNPFDLEERENPSRIGERTSHTSVSPIEGNPTFSQFDSRAPSITTFAHRQSDVSQLTPEG